MSQRVSVGCRCGTVRGHLEAAAPSAVNHIICYCDDCQAFAHWLEQGELLDAHGGTEIVQVAPARLKIEQGLEAIRCVRLSSKGMYRFYAGCCRTPAGNMVGPRFPLVGIPRAFFDASLGSTPALESVGPVTARVQGRFAVGGMPPNVEERASLRTIGTTVKKLLGWWLSGLSQPSPYFDASSHVLRVELRVLSEEERNALREPGGPGSAAPAPRV